MKNPRPSPAIGLHRYLIRLRSAGDEETTLNQSQEVPHFAGSGLGAAMGHYGKDLAKP